MKTYKAYGTCRNHQGSAYPVVTPSGSRWASRIALEAMRTVESADFATANLPDQREHDRLFALVTDGESWGTRFELSRGFPGEWPNITLHADEQAAREAFAADIAQYEADGRWTRLETSTAD